MIESQNIIICTGKTIICVHLCASVDYPANERYALACDLWPLIPIDLQIVPGVYCEYLHKAFDHRFVSNAAIDYRSVSSAVIGHRCLPIA